MRRRAFVCGTAGLMVTAMADTPLKARSAPLIIAHRGASGARPEHTLEGYQLAHDLGADVIEPDLVFTKDGHLICRHDRYLSGSTNVADVPAFLGRKTLKAGHSGPDWFAEDFTLDEIKSLRARQAFHGRSTGHDDRYDIPTFAEVLDAAKRGGWRIYPEAKDPAAAIAHGHDFRAALQPFFDCAAQGQIGPSFVQCFDPAFLKPLGPLANVARIQLLDADMLQYARLDDIAGYCDGVGPDKAMLIDANGAAKSSGFVEKAHNLGLTVHPWTFRSDDLSAPFETAGGEYQFYFDLGVDGVFSDFTGDAVAARAAHQAAH